MSQASPLITKAEAAAYLRQSVRNFERHIQPVLLATKRMTQIGGRFYTTKEILDQWLAEQLCFTSAPVEATPTLMPPSVVTATVKRSRPKISARSDTPLSGRAAKKLAQLSKPPKGATPKSSEDEPSSLPSAS
jgi:hypothetical protein